MREDYLSRPAWLYDIGKYPMSLCPHVGEDGEPRRTSTGAPIFATEDRTLRRPSWLVDPGKCPHIVHYGAHRKSSSGAPLFALEEQSLRRASWPGKHAAAAPPGAPPGEGAAPRRTSTGALVFATEDGNVRRPSWLTNTDKYPAAISPQLAEERGPRKSSAGVPAPGPDDGHLKRPSWPPGDRRRSQNLPCPSVVEVRPHALPPFEEGRQSRGSPSVIREEEPPASPPPARPPGARGALALVITGAPRADGAPPPPDGAGSLLSLVKERDVHRALAVTDLRLLTLRCRVLRGPAVGLRGAGTEGPPVRHQRPPRDAPSPPGRPAARPPGAKGKRRPPASGPRRGPSALRGPFLPGRSATNWAAWKWSAEARPGRAPAPPAPGRSLRFDFRFPKAPELLAARSKRKAEAAPPAPAPSAHQGQRVKSCPFMDNYDEFKARMSGKDGPTKPCKAPPAPGAVEAQLLEAQGFKLLHILLMKKPQPRAPRADPKSVPARAAPSAEEVRLGASSSALTKRPKLDLNPKSAEDRVTRHLAVSEAIKDLQWFKADSPTPSAHRTASLPRTEGQSTPPQAARAQSSPPPKAAAAADIQEAGTESKAEDAPVEGSTETPQAAQAAGTAVDTQTAGTRSTTEVATVGEAAQSTEVTGGIASLPKVVGRAPGVPRGRPTSSQDAKQARPLVATKNVYLTMNLMGRDSGVWDARGYSKPREARSLEDDSPTKLVCQTLHLGRVTLLPGMVNPEDFLRQRAATSSNVALRDLGITGVNLSRTHLQEENLQVAKSGHRVGPCPTPYSSAHTSVVTPGGGHEDAEDTLPKYPRGHTQSPNRKEFEQQKLQKLKDTLRVKMRESSRKASMQGKRNKIRQQLQQNRKQLYEEPLLVKGHNTSSPKHSVITNEPYRRKSAEPPREAFEEHEMRKKRKDSTSSYKKPSTDFKEQNSKKYKRLELDITNKLSKPPRTFQLVDPPAIDTQESPSKKTNKDRAERIRNVSSEFLQQRSILQKKVNELDTMTWRDDQLTSKKQKPLGFVKADPYKDFHVVTDKEKQRKTHKPIFASKSWIENTL